MWNWTSPLRAWAMRETWLSNTSGVQLRSLAYRFESGGLAFQNETIPWNAEGLFVEAVVHCPPRRNIQPADFALKLEAGGGFAAESMRPDRPPGTYRLSFRVPIPHRSLMVQLFHGKWGLGQLTLPVLSQQEFVAGLACRSPALHVRLGGRYVACQSFVAAQGRGVLASIILNSPSNLTPLLELGLHLEVYDQDGECIGVEAVGLSASHLAGREAVIIASPTIPRKTGGWRLDWLVGKECIHSQEIRAISSSQFLSQLKVSDMRFLTESAAGERRLTTKLPKLTDQDRVGPCFAVFSTVRGTAGLARVRVNALVTDAIEPPVLAEEEQLVTDGPTLVLPGTIAAADVAQITGFEVRLGRKNLGTLLLRPAPQAQFDAEGGFELSEGFTWDGRAEEELNERLGALLVPGREASSARRN